MHNPLGHHSLALRKLNNHYLSQLKPFKPLHSLLQEVRKGGEMLHEAAFYAFGYLRVHFVSVCLYCILETAFLFQKDLWYFGTHILVLNFGKTL